MRDWSSNHWNL